MKIEILCEGKIKRDHNISLCNEYCDRVRKLKRSGVTELKINKLSEVNGFDPRIINQTQGSS